MVTATEIAVHARNVVKTYGSGTSAVTALRGIDLDVNVGELLMLVGPSGCGKTTLISVIAGILDQDSGECRVFDHDLKAMPQNDRTRFRGKTIGFVFQALNLLPTLSAAENVSIPLLLNGVPRREALDRARDGLARVGLGDRTKDLPAQLSGGQQQRGAIARALVHAPKLIVCDEPTSALDHETGQHVMELMRDVAVAADRSLVIVTHDARIFDFADRIAKMDDGRVQRVVESSKDL
ncbi:MAG: ABC transporter ATP-binding protein [Planctomycetes bacterium]|nr:ABC transporter ATP-binding protein [Planctomycetota bacterium]MBI3848626.1 ABC transporter ATP-binding protein [Planctomycetota bacterium]